MKNICHFCLILVFLGTLFSLSWGVAGILMGINLLNVLVYIVSFLAQIYILAVGQDETFTPSLSKMWEVFETWGPVNVGIWLISMLFFIGMGL